MLDFENGANRTLVWGVAGLLQAVHESLGTRFSVCSVRGELSSFARAPSGHCYLTLKDAQGRAATLRCAMFRRAAGQLSFQPRDGQLVDLVGRLVVYEARGELQFVIESMKPVGEGALYEKFLKLKAKLEAQGHFDAARKRPIPPFPVTLGVVTSLAAAALRDVVKTLARRVPHVRVVIYPCLVQGAEAPATLIAAIALANQHAQADCLLLCRGGGSLEDLWAFNDERLISAITSSRLPIISAVGHETDITLADLAADLRAATPTAGAELVAIPTATRLADLAQHRLRMGRCSRHLLDVLAQRLDMQGVRLGRALSAVHRQGHILNALGQRLLAAPRRQCESKAHQLSRAAQRFMHAGCASALQHRHRMNTLATRLQALDPQLVVSRGYAWLEDSKGHPVVGVKNLSLGETVTAVLRDGQVEAQVTKLHSDP